MGGAARFQNINTRGPTRNEPMRDNGTQPRTMDAAEGSIVVKASVVDVYQRWLAFEDYPKFITAIKRVRKLDANHFVASLGFNGKQYETTLEMMLCVPERIHEDLRIQHPEWVEPNGDCPTCDSYELRLAELLGISQRSKAVRIGKSSFLGGASDY